MLRYLVQTIRTAFAKDLTRNFLWGMFQTLGKQGVSFLIFMIGTTLLSKEGIGEYTYLMGIIVILILFVDLGVSTSTSKYVAEYIETDGEKLKATMFNSLLIIFCTATLVSALVIWHGQSVLKQHYDEFLYFLPIIFFSPLASVLDGIYRGKREFRKLAILTISSGLISVVAAFFLVTNYSFMGLALSQNFLYGLLFLMLLLGMTGVHTFKLNKEVIRNVFGYSLTFSIATLGYYLFSNINGVLMGNFGYFRELAYYELLNKLFIIPLLPFTILGQVLAPVFTGHYARKDYKRVFDDYKKYLKRMFIVGGVFIVVALCIIPLFVFLLANKYFDPFLFTLFIPLLFLFTEMAMSAPMTSGIIVSTGHAGLMMGLNILSGIISATASYLLLREGMVVESVYSMLIVHTLAFILMNIIFYRKMQSKI
jgi:O-antigen/teichoic acid export membrane protein